MTSRLGFNRSRAFHVLHTAICLTLLGAFPALSRAADAAPDPGELARELAQKGWILFAAKAPPAQYDLFLARPDGSDRRNITQTAEWNEFGGRFSPDSKRILYRRQKPGGEINHDLWGAAGALVVADADGSSPVVQGQRG